MVTSFQLEDLRILFRLFHLFNLDLYFLNILNEIFHFFKILVGKYVPNSNFVGFIVLKIVTNHVKVLLKISYYKPCSPNLTITINLCSIGMFSERGLCDTNGRIKNI